MRRELFRTSYAWPCGLLFVCILGLLSASCAVTRPPLVYIDGVAYGTTEGIWRDRWWSYYEAGIDYARVDEGLKLAAESFRHAIAQRPADRYGVRTYGVHFLEEYFPHRELGIVLYRQGEFDTAVRELETSRSHTDSARARYYLNRAVGARLQALDLDATPPVIRVISPEAGSITNRFSVELTGSVQDDRGVVALTINGTPYDLELAREKVVFTAHLDLDAGENVVNLRAEDLTGKSGTMSVTVMADWDGPVLAVSSPVPDEVVRAAAVEIRGTVADQSGVSSVQVDGLDVAVEGVPGAVAASFAYQVALQPGANTIHLAATDAVGNTTISELRVTSGQPGTVLDIPRPAQPRRVMLAMAADYLPIRYAVAADTPGVGAGSSISPVDTSSLDQQDEPVRILLADLRDYQRTFYDWTRVTGTVTSTRPLRTVEINGRALSAASLDRAHVSFSRKIQLRVGENSVTVQAQDVDGRTASRSVQIERREPELAGVTHRMALAMPKCIKIGQVDPATADLAFTLLDQAFISGRRFNMPARGTDLQPVLDELALSSTIFVDPDTVQRKGRLVGADAVLLVSVTEWNDQVSILTRLINTETGTQMAEDTVPDVFAEGKSIGILRDRMQILADRYAMAFPLLKGSVVAVRGNDVVTNVGGAEGLKEQMKFHVYKELGSIADPETGEKLLTDIDVRSQAFIHSVYERGSRADVVNRDALDRIEVGDSVMTK